MTTWGTASHPILEMAAEEPHRRRASPPGSRGLARPAPSLHSRSDPAVAGVAPPAARLFGPPLQLREPVVRDEAGRDHRRRVADASECGVQAAARLELWRRRIARQIAVTVLARRNREPVEPG